VGLASVEEGIKVIYVKNNKTEVEQFIRDKGEDREEKDAFPPALDNADIRRYNDKIDQELEKIGKRFSSLQEECDEKHALLMSFGKDNLPEVKELIRIVFSS
jgi:hypothetical protein